MKLTCPSRTVASSTTSSIFNSFYNASTTRPSLYSSVETGSKSTLSTQRIPPCPFRSIPAASSTTSRCFSSSSLRHTQSNPSTLTTIYPTSKLDHGIRTSSINRLDNRRTFSSTSTSTQPSPAPISSLPKTTSNSEGQSYYPLGLGTTHLSNEILMRVTVLDSKGTVKLSQGTFKKSDLCSEHGLEPRDLRKIDSRVPNLVPTILARRSGFLINILHIRALVKADTVLLFDSYGAADTHLNSAFLYNLEHNLRHSSPTSLPYEFRALESILASVLDALRSELFLLRDLVSNLLETLDADIDREKLRLLLQYSRKLSGFLGRSRGVKNAVVEVLDDDEDMATMYLSESSKGNPRMTNSHEELELLLESFDKQVEEVLAETENMAGNIQTTQEVVELILDSNRNQLLTLDLKTSIATLGVGVGTLWVGFFGQNLLSGFEESPHAFWGSSAFATVLVLILASRGMRRLSNLRRIGLGMSSNKPRRSFLESWRHRRELSRQQHHQMRANASALDSKSSSNHQRPLAEDGHETSMQRWRRALMYDFWQRSNLDKKVETPPPWWGSTSHHQSQNHQQHDSQNSDINRGQGQKSAEELRKLFKEQNSRAMTSNESSGGGAPAAGFGGKWQKRRKTQGGSGNTFTPDE